MKFKFRLKWLAFWRYFRKTSSDLDIWGDPSIPFIFEHMSRRDLTRVQSMFRRWKSLGEPSNQDRHQLTLLVGREEYLYFGDEQVHSPPVLSRTLLYFSHKLDRNAVQLSTTELSVRIVQWLVTTFPNVQSLEIELNNQSSLGPADQVASMLKYWKLTNLKVVVDDGQALRRLIEPINGLTELKYLSLYCDNFLDHHQPVDLVALAQLKHFYIFTRDNIGIILDSLQNHADGSKLKHVWVSNSTDDDHLSQVLQLDSLVACSFRKMILMAPNKLTSDDLYDLGGRFTKLELLKINPLPSNISFFQLAYSLASLRRLHTLYVEIASVDQLKLYGSAMAIYAVPQLTTVKSFQLTIMTIRHYVMNLKHLKWITPNAIPFTYALTGCATCGYADWDAIDKSAKDKCKKQHWIDDD